MLVQKSKAFRVFGKKALWEHGEACGCHVINVKPESEQVQRANVGSVFAGDSP